MPAGPVRFVELKSEMVVSETHEVIFSSKDIPVTSRPDLALFGTPVVVEFEGEYYRWSVSPVISSGTILLGLKPSFLPEPVSKSYSSLTT